MAVLNIPDQQFNTADAVEIRTFLNARGIWFDQWEAKESLEENAEQAVVLNSYAHVLQPFMQKNGYQTADVININSTTPNYEALRNKFLREHRHTEDEVRFFVAGKGYFWFNLDNGSDPVFNVLCEAGDLISVPANTRHWFDAGQNDPSVKAIRMFIDQSGWTPHYTESGVDQTYQTARANV
ncbi:MAG: cupin domain-containing protein [Saprospiraceae bacterium]|nr:cupin domain-containing protein [Saprospiraceae bacterium]MDZ4702518.1 cupin domain-containing protein [Saprospiraceae bacterium]